VWRNSLPIPNPSPTVQTCTVVLRACPEAVAQKERLASLGQASLEFVHANNPIPEIASRRCTRMDRILSRMSSRSPSAFETAEKRQTPFGIASNTSTSSDHRRAPVTPNSVSNHFDQLDLRAPSRARLWCGPARNTDAVRTTRSKRVPKFRLHRRKF
jgi:hypothetical protein